MLARFRWGMSLRVLILGAVLGIFAIVFISCSTLSNRALVAPPNIPGAKFVGSKECAQCHEDKTKGFKFATHARLQAKGENAKNVGCESCHGPGSLHVESGGGRGTIINPRKSPETCFQCHLDKRGEFSLPHTHPVLQGKISCADCHNPHEGDAVMAGGTGILGQNDVCFKCHTAQKGPFIFEHEALREGCTVCHSPHGSVNARMLTERNGNLCLRCHFQQQTVDGRIFIGAQDHTMTLEPATTGSAVSQGGCFVSHCHADVHGSNTNRHFMPSG